MLSQQPKLTVFRQNTQDYDRGRPEAAAVCIGCAPPGLQLPTLAFCFSSKATVSVFPEPAASVKAVSPASSDQLMIGIKDYHSSCYASALSMLHSLSVQRLCWCWNVPNPRGRGGRGGEVGVAIWHDPAEAKQQYAQNAGLVLLEEMQGTGV